MTPLDDATKIADELMLDTSVSNNTCKEQDDDTLSFKEILEETSSDKTKQTKSSKDKTEPSLTDTPLMSLFELSSKLQTGKESQAVKESNKVSDISFVIQKILEEVKTVMCVMHQEGIYETSCTLMQPDSIFDGLEISVFSFKNAPNEFNVEIKSCTSTLALLQKNLHKMSQQLEALSLPFIFKRIDLSIKKNDPKNGPVKSYIKPVTEAKNNFHDQQT